MKKKSSVEKDDSLYLAGSLPEDDMKKILLEIFKDPIFGKDAKVIPLPKNDKFISSMQKLDKWILKILMENPNTKIIQGEEYPYKSYINVDELFRKYGKLFIEQLIKKCPITTDTNSMIDSIAYIIYKKKIDPNSVIGEIPTYKSLWDKISDKSHV